jgi:hypothetical protein
MKVPKESHPRDAARTVTDFANTFFALSLPRTPSRPNTKRKRMKEDALRLSVRLKRKESV